MHDIETILKNERYRVSRWDGIISSEKKEERFLVFLIPIFEYVLTLLEQSVAKELISANSILSKELLFNTVKHDLSANLKLMIIRICVLEMHAARIEGFLQGSTPEQRFDYFIEQLQAPENAIALLKKYPLLKQQIEIFIEQYLTTRKEFFDRLCQNKNELIQTFLSKDKTYQLMEISTAGDRHRQGRGVAILTFNNKKEERKIVYKPRSLAIDVAFQDLIHWFNHYLPDIKLFQQTILDKADYGWCEFVSYKECADQKAVEHFYQRMGYWLMLVYLLGGSDLHFENIIAHGEHPVIVDYECFLKPFFLLDESNNKTPSRHLVTETLFLPNKIMVSKEYAGFDLSALGGEGGETAMYQAMEWENSGTDEMRMIRAPKKIPPSHNIPKLLNQAEIDPLDHWQFFLRGFREAYQIILNNFAHLFSTNSPLHKFKNVEVRVLFRSTSDYGKLLIESYHPKLLINPTERQAHFHWLHQVTEDYPLVNTVVDSELVDINEGNIPAFFCNSNGLEILDSHGKKLAISVLLSGWQCVQHHIKNFINEDDLFLQKTLIENSFEAMRLNKGAEKKDNSKSKPFLENTLSLAKQQLDLLLKLHIENRERIFWPAVERVANTTWNPIFTDINLYSGVAGITLTFAYAGAVFKESRYTTFAQKGLYSLRQTLRERGAKCFETVGAYSGIGSLIYFFGSLYKIWHDESLKKDIENLCLLLPDFINKDIYFDIISGSAGCIAGLLSVREIIDKNIIDPLLTKCVSRILEKHPAPEKFPVIGNIFNSTKPLCGFSHGVAGIAWALAHVNHIMPSEKLQQWITLALNYERKEFNAEKNNWPDFRKEKTAYMSAWCHGAPGIGLARLDMPDIWQDDLLHKEIECAVQAIINSAPDKHQGLCHGNLGNLELLLQNSLRNPTIKNKQLFSERAAAIIATIQQYGAQCELASPQATPGLMTGIAGVAYQLMRLVKPADIPNILLLA